MAKTRPSRYCIVASWGIGFGARVNVCIALRWLLNTTCTSPPADPASPQMAQRARAGRLAVVRVRAGDRASAGHVQLLRVHRLRRRPLPLLAGLARPALQPQRTQAVYVAHLLNSTSYIYGFRMDLGLILHVLVRFFFKIL